MYWRRRRYDEYAEYDYNSPFGPPSEKQEAFLKRNGIVPGSWTRGAATEAIGEFIRARRQLPPTPAQETVLRRSGRWRDGMTRGEAFDLIGETPARDEA